MTEDCRASAASDASRLAQAAARLVAGERLTLDEFAALVRDGANDEAVRGRIAARAVEIRRAVYGDEILVRGLVEISSYCKNDCYYCGIRSSNVSAARCRMSEREILECAAKIDEKGYGTIVLQSGEDAHFTDALLCGLIKEIKRRYPKMAVTLCLGERGYESFRRMREAGADRYLLRHETADAAHYRYLHPASMSFENRFRSLHELRELGYQVGCGFMVGSPGQTPETIAKDLDFIATFKPEMCGIGPFVPHHATPFANERGGTVELTCFLLSVIRIIHPPVLLPSTTAMGAIDPEGREKGLRAGANVIMLNQTPDAMRHTYNLYDNIERGG